LAAHHTRRCRIVQTGTAAPATVGNIIEDLVRVIDQLQRKPLRTRLLPRLATGLAAQRPRRRGLFRSVRGWWLRRIPAVPPHLPPQLGNLSPQHIDHRPELRVLRGNLLIGRTSIGKHHTMINKSTAKIN
jgi:hypothetical protein